MDVEFHDRFRREIIDLPADVRVELLAHLVLLREKGFRLGRPEVDTLESSRHANMKELRVKVLKAVRLCLRSGAKVCGSLWWCEERCESEALLQAADRSGGQTVRRAFERVGEEIWTISIS